MIWYSVREAAGLLSLSVDTTYALVASARIAHRRIGPRRGKVQISDAAIEAYLQSCEVPVAREADPPAPVARRRMPARSGMRFDGKPYRFLK